MLTKAWIDPRDVDWTDALNAQRNPGWKTNLMADSSIVGGNNPYVARATQDVFLHALQHADGIEPRFYVGPEPANQLVPAGQTQDYEVPSEPNFWCYAIAASSESESPADFLVNVTDSQTGATFFVSPVSMAVINPGRNGTAGRGRQFFLSTPHLFRSPAYPVIRIINTFDAAQVCRVTLFGAVEYDL